FAHGGVLPPHVDYGLRRINHEAREWMIFEGLEVPAILDSEDGPEWTRAYGEPGATDCALVAEALARAGARRMVIGHTVQSDGITTDCGDTLYRIDVGLSAYYGGPVEA